MSALEAAKTTTPDRNIRRRPKMSPSRPPVTSSTAKLSVYAFTVHSSDESDALRSRWIDGSATFTTVLSSMIMKSAKHMAPRVHHLRLPSWRRMRSGIGGVLGGGGRGEGGGVIGGHDGQERLGESLAVGGVDRRDEVLDAGNAQLEHVLCDLAAGVGERDLLDAAVVRVLGAGHEAALEEAVDRAAGSGHREAVVVGERLDR